MLTTETQPYRRYWERLQQRVIDQDLCIRAKKSLKWRLIMPGMNGVLTVKADN